MSESQAPVASDELVDLLNKHPQASKQLTQHWLAAHYRSDPICHRRRFDSFWLAYNDF